MESSTYSDCDKSPRVATSCAAINAYANPHRILSQSLGFAGGHKIGHKSFDNPLVKILVKSASASTGGARRTAASPVVVEFKLRKVSLLLFFRGRPDDAAHLSTETTLVKFGSGRNSHGAYAVPATWKAVAHAGILPRTARHFHAPRRTGA